MTRILVVDDEPGVGYAVRAMLEDAGHEVLVHQDGHQALHSLQEDRFDLMITDLAMPHLDGMELLRQARARHPALPVIMMTAHGNEQRAVAAMKAGAWDYLKKPFEMQDLLTTVETAIERLQLRRENAALRAMAGLSRPIIHQSESMTRLMAMVHRVAQRNVPVLVRGETGTGKELVARALHELSARREKPFVAVNVATLPAGLLESELFGHDKGAFSGAVRAHVGLFERAHGGTLLLDEIGDLPVELQARLLRVLQEGEFTAVGAMKSTRVDVRVVCATHRNLAAEVQRGRFREDLYYRLNVVELVLPPLRERREDVAPILSHVVATHAQRLNMEGVTLAPEVVATLVARDWPGNVRELEHAVERLLSLSDGECVRVQDLHVLGTAAPPGEAPLSLRERVDAFEAQLIRESLDRAGGNQSAAARDLRVSRVTLIDKIRRHNIRPRGNPET